MCEFLANFKKKPLMDRKVQALNIIKKYPERIPVIITKNNDCNIPDIDIHKFLAPTNMMVSQFIRVIKKKIDVSPTTAIFIFINDTIPSSNENMGNLHRKYKDEDCFLYITYATENTFG